MLLENRKPGLANNDNPCLHYLQLTFQKFFQRKFQDMVNVPWLNVLTNNGIFFNKLIGLKKNAREKLIKIKTSGCLLLTLVKTEEF